MDFYKLHRGDTPLLISLPHAGSYIPEDIRARMGQLGKRQPDIDWHTDQLYDFAKEDGAGLLVATHSRYVVDLNRAPADEDLYPGQVKTGLVPTESFEGHALYNRDQAPDALEIQLRAEKYWLPYHTALTTELKRLREKFGYAILYDAHSIAAELPRLFEGRLPDLNLGTAKGKSCAPQIERGVISLMEESGFSHTVNDRFIGGYITRNYGRPAEHIHALQMELVRGNYLTEDSPPYLYDAEKAEKLQAPLRKIIRWLARTEAGEAGR